MKITLTPETMYAVTCNGVRIGTFRKGITWHGLTELLNPTDGGFIAILDKAEIDSALERLFGSDDQPREADVVVASHNMLRKLSEAAKEKSQTKEGAAV